MEANEGVEEELEEKGCCEGRRCWYVDGKLKLELGRVAGFGRRVNEKEGTRSSSLPSTCKGRIESKLLRTVFAPVLFLFSSFSSCSCSSSVN
jgi:hypothetical protein